MSGANRAALQKIETVQSEIARKNGIACVEKAASSAAISELYARYSRRLYQTIIAITQDPDDAEDALQDTFLRIYLALNRFEGRSNVYSWMTRIAINSALLILRRRRARREISFDLHSDPLGETFHFEIEDSAPNPEQIFELRERRVKLLRAIHNLDASLRRPIQMQVSQGSSLKEIGGALNISEAAVKVRLYRARRRLSVPCRDIDTPKTMARVVLDASQEKCFRPGNRPNHVSVGNPPQIRQSIVQMHHLSFGSISPSTTHCPHNSLRTTSLAS
jgi:RNA polymerase sigma-70 factor, ECF subfamily